MANQIPNQPIKDRFIGGNALDVLAQVMESLHDEKIINRDQKKKMLEGYTYRNADAWNCFIKRMAQAGLIVDYDDLMNSDFFFFSIRVGKWRKMTEKECEALLENIDLTNSI